jgi:thymidylate synthase ThyX
MCIGTKAFDPDLHGRTLYDKRSMPRVLAVAPLPPEKCAYALARYSRSADSIRDSLEWVRTHDSQKFLESFYFQYGHSSIADLGHVVLCLEGISELAATEAEDEQLWDGQAKSSRYQNFSQMGFVVPPEFSPEDAQRYRAAGERLLTAYARVHARAAEYFREQLPRPEDMRPEAYARNIAARAFDVARYLLFMGVPTNVGQVTSIRTLERQIRRLKASPFGELRQLGDEIAHACTEPPACTIEPSASPEPVAPTLAKYVDADLYAPRTQSDLRAWAEANLPGPAHLEQKCVDLIRAEDVSADIAASLLYPVTNRPYRELYEVARSWSSERREELFDVAVHHRGRGDELPRAFRGGPYVFDIVMDIGAYRDMHRHRRCQQIRQEYTSDLGFETPKAIADAGLGSEYEAALSDAAHVASELPAPARQYLLPFASRSRFLFKMDFAEAEYIARLRTGVKGHFSYRNIAWQMKCEMERIEPELSRLVHATPPWLEDLLTR